MRFGRAQRTGPYGPDNPDPAPDCFAVHRVGGEFMVKHYPHVDATTPCCVIRVAQLPGESDIETLQRAKVPCELQGGRMKVIA